VRAIAGPRGHSPDRIRLPILRGIFPVPTGQRHAALYQTRPERHPAASRTPAHADGSCLAGGGRGDTRDVRADKRLDAGPGRPGVLPVTTPMVFLDFDGTITRRDATDAILEAYADPRWLQLEEAWKHGRIGSRECLTAQMALVRASREEIDALL